MCDSCPRHHGSACGHAGHCYSPEGFAWHRADALRRAAAVRTVAHRVALLVALIVGVYLFAFLVLFALTS